MKVVLAGNGLAACNVCDLLCEAHADPLCISPPEHPAWQEDLAVRARTWGLNCLTPEDINAVTIGQPDLFLSVYYPQIFRGELLERIRGRALNFHPSLLPRHRGVSPLLFALMEDDERTGVTIHHIDDGIDTGRIVMQWSFPIEDSDTGYDLHLKAAALVREMAAELLPPLLNGGPIPEGYEQHGEPSYHSRADYVSGVDLDWPLGRQDRVARALAPPLT